MKTSKNVEVLVSSFLSGRVKKGLKIFNKIQKRVLVYVNFVYVKLRFLCKVLFSLFVKVLVSFFNTQHSGVTGFITL